MGLRCYSRESVAVSRGLQVNLVFKSAEQGKLSRKSLCADMFACMTQKLRVAVVTASAAAFAFVNSPAHSDPAVNALNLSVSAPRVTISG